MYNKYLDDRGPFIPVSQPKKPPLFGGGFGFLNGLLPERLDSGDILLLLTLLLLYIESRDEDFLIILLVAGFSIFNAG